MTDINSLVSASDPLKSTVGITQVYAINDSRLMLVLGTSWFQRGHLLPAAGALARRCAGTFDLRESGCRDEEPTADAHAD